MQEGTSEKTKKTSFSENKKIEKQENFDKNLEFDDNESDFSEVDIEKLNSEINIYKEKLLRIAAEYDNYRKRSEKEKNQIFSNATESSVLNLLPVIDSIEMAFSNMKDVNEACKKGIEMVKNQLSSSLEKMNIKSFGKIGDEFTPEFHNAASHVENDEMGKNIITDVFQKGYMHCEKVIRHATVQVAN